MGRVDRGNQVRTAFPGEWEKRGQNIDGYRPSGGESFSDLAFRALPAFDRIMNKGRKNGSCRWTCGREQGHSMRSFSACPRDIFSDFVRTTEV